MCIRDSVTPLYYYGMSAQLKTMIDRFCAFNSSIQRLSLIHI